MITLILIIALVIFIGLIPAALSVWIFTTEKKGFERIIIIIFSPICFWFLPLWIIEVAQDILFKFGL